MRKVKRALQHVNRPARGEGWDEASLEQESSVLAVVGAAEAVFLKHLNYRLSEMSTLSGGNRERSSLDGRGSYAEARHMYSPTYVLISVSHMKVHFHPTSLRLLMQARLTLDLFTRRPTLLQDEVRMLLGVGNA